MTEIGLLSDTHGYLDPTMLPYLEACDQIWHAGDVGDIKVYRTLQKTGKSLHVVFGNIDGRELRVETAERLTWQVEGKRVFMTHIGGYPGHYPASLKSSFVEERPDIFVCGHSHILRVMYDKQYNMLVLNPGACGKSGFHQVRTLLRFAIAGTEIRDMRVIELGSRV